MTTTFPKRGSNPDNRFQPFCLEQPQQQSKRHTKKIGPFILITLIVGLLFPFLAGQNTNPIIFNPQIEDPDGSSIIPEYGVVFDIVSTSDGGSAFLTLFKTPAIDDELYILGFDRIALIKTDINGTVLWSVSFQDLVMFEPFLYEFGGLCGVTYWDPPGLDDIGPTNLIQTSDNGFLFSCRFKTNPNDMCLVKVGNNGNLLWTKNYQIKPNQRGCTIVDLIEANEGGYAFILETWINQENVTENWLVKTDNDGVVQWYKSFEENGDDSKLIALIQTAEGGYCLLGKSDIFYDGDYGYQWHEIALYGKINLIKADKNGNLEWLKNLDRIVIPSSSMLVKQTEKEEFILSGYFINEKTLGLMKLSSDGEQLIWEKFFDISWEGYYNHFFSNSLLTIEEDAILLLKRLSVRVTHLVSFTDNGVKKWEKTYEGSFPFIDNTKDTNLLMGGVCNFTTCVMKINTTGSPIWKRIYHPPNDSEIVTHVLSTTDGGVLLYGITNSFGAGKYDLWLLKTNSYGDVEWQKTFGSKYDEYPMSILESKDGGHFFVGQREVKTVAEGSGSIFFGKITNNGDLSWNLTIDFSDGTGGNAITFIKQTTDEGYIIGGTASLDVSNSWILKLNKHGLIQWKKDYTSSSPPIQTLDDGFIIIKGSISDGDSSITISKFDNSGDLQWKKRARQPYCGWKLISTPNAYFLLLQYEPEGPSGEPIEIVKLNLHGEIEWQKNVPYSHSEDHTFICEINDGYLVWSTRRSGRIISKYNFQGNKEWEEEYLCYIPNFNKSDSHLFCFNNDSFSKITTDGIQEWKTHTLLTPIDEDESRWTELSNGNIVILRENDENTTPDLHIITKTETIPCTPNFINNSFTTSVRTIVATPDGGCVVAGEKILTQDHPSRDIYLLKLSNTGLVEWIQTYAVKENQIEGFLIKENFIITPSSTPAPGWEPVPLLVAIVVMAMWHRRRKRLK